MKSASPFPPSPEDRPRGDAGLDRTLLDLIVRAGRDPGLSPPYKAVFLAVVAHAVEDGVCSATDQALARDSRTSVPTVQRTLKLFEGRRVFRRSYRPKDLREIRLLTGEHPLVVAVDEFKGSQDQKEQQQHGRPRDHSPVSSPVESERIEPLDDADEEAERLVALLATWKITRPVAQRLVLDHPERIVPQVEAHRHRVVRNPAGSLVTAIREDWPTDPPERRQTAKEAEEEARRALEADRRAGLEAQAAENARRRVEEEKVLMYWDGLSQDQKSVFEEEAIETSPHRDFIRSLSPGDPMHRGHRAAARWEHVRRKLGLDVLD